MIKNRYPLPLLYKHTDLLRIYKMYVMYKIHDQMLIEINGSCHMYFMMVEEITIIENRNMSSTNNIVEGHIVSTHFSNMTHSVQLPQSIYLIKYWSWKCVEYMKAEFLSWKYRWLQFTYLYRNFSDNFTFDFLIREMKLNECDLSKIVLVASSTRE